MTDENKDTQSVSVEEYNKLQDDFKAQSEKLSKLWCSLYFLHTHVCFLRLWKKICK